MTLMSPLQAPWKSPSTLSKSVHVSLLQCPIQGGEKLQLLWLSPISTSTCLHTASKFQLAEKPIKYLCGTLVETELALPLLPHHRPEMGRMKLIPSTQLLSSPSFQILNAIVMVLPLMWDLQLLCPCCICKCHLQ